MITWSIDFGTSNGIFIIRLMKDIKIAEACFDNSEKFATYLDIIEEGREVYPQYPIDIRNALLKNVKNLNWDGYND